jgi:hypothetical protein
MRQNLQSLEASFKEVSTGNLVLWNKIAGIPGSGKPFDGIWKSRRGYIGLIGDVMINTSSLWFFSYSMAGVQLTISPDCVLELGFAGIHRLMWKGLSPQRRRSRLNTEASRDMIWTRSGANTFFVLRPVESRLRLEVIRSITHRRELEVLLLDQLVVHQSRTHVENVELSLQELGELIEKTQSTYILLGYVSSLRVALMSSSSTKDDRMNTIIQQLLELERAPSTEGWRKLLA